MERMISDQLKITLMRRTCKTDKNIKKIAAIFPPKKINKVPQKNEKVHHSCPLLLRDLKKCCNFPPLFKVMFNKENTRRMDFLQF